MTDLQTFAFVVLPVIIMIAGAAFAYFSSSNGRTIGH
ncbi:hypothetical protein AMST5_03609 [freshwater sediment metagenome]|uniref:Uncharacterized protein n=1 Tax=freshwater sediment metagenome TaxID=556182 RepID=A0AA48RBP4_9ZZZZ